MAKIARVLIAAVALALTAACFAACGSGSSNAPNTSDSQSSATSANAQQPQQSAASTHDSGKHVIGVAVYDVGDNEVIMFRQYLEEYIAGVCFDDVEFLYSNSLSTTDDVLAFIDDVAAHGGEGIMSFFSLDLPAEVERCAQHGMYHIVASGTVSKEDFAAVEDNEYFLGCIGPGDKVEFYTGVDMVQNFVKRASGNRYFILTGGASMGNEMHLLRAKAMLDTLAGSYHADLGDTEALATSAEPVTVDTGRLLVTVAPGYLNLEDMRATVEDAFKAGEYDYVMSTIPVEPILDTLDESSAIIGQVDCYTQDNQLLFQRGKLDFLAGKYGSMVGPSFAAMYNAVTGYADDFRDNGKAFRATQGMWTSESVEQFNEMYEFASNLITPAYNYEDIYSICRVTNPGATLEDLIDMAEACSFEDALARRGELAEQ